MCDWGIQYHHLCSTYKGLEVVQLSWFSSRVLAAKASTVSWVRLLATASYFVKCVYKCCICLKKTLQSWNVARVWWSFVHLKIAQIIRSRIPTYNENLQWRISRYHKRRRRDWFQEESNNWCIAVSGSVWVTLILHRRCYPAYQGTLIKVRTTHNPCTYLPMLLYMRIVNMCSQIPGS